MRIFVYAFLILLLTSMKIKYNKMQLDFEIKSISLKYLKSSNGDFDKWTIFENEYSTDKSELDLSVRIIDFTKNGKVKNYALTENEYKDILLEYIEDVKMTGMVNSLENIEPSDDDWDKYSAVLKMSQNKFSYNHFCAKRFDNYMVVASIGSTEKSLFDLKTIGREFVSNFKIEK